MRQKIHIPEIGYRESFDGIDFDPYPAEPDEMTEFIVKVNTERRVSKMMDESPNIMEYKVSEIIDDIEDDADYDRVIHPGLAVYIDELRVAGFCRVETPLEEYFTPRTNQVYIPVESYTKFLGMHNTIFFDDSNPS